MRRTPVLAYVAAALLLLSLVPNVLAQSSSQPISSVSFISYTNPVVAGGTASVTVLVVAYTSLDVHIEFKAHSARADWTYSSDVESISSVGLKQVTGRVSVPLETEIVPGLYFYYYVWIAPPGQPFTSDMQAVSTASNTIIILPSLHVTHDELVILMSHIKHEIKSSFLPSGTKTSLIYKLDRAAEVVDSAYLSGSLNQLVASVHYLDVFINELDSYYASSYPDSTLWINQANFVIGRLELAIG